MARIPTYTRQETIPGRSGNAMADVGAAGMVGRAVQGLGGSIMKVADVIGDHQQKMKAQDDEITAQTIANAFDEEARTFEIDERQKTGEDAYDNITRAKDFTTDAQKRLLDGINSERVKNAVINHISGRSNTLYGSLAVHQADQRKAVTVRTIENSLSSMEKDAYDGAQTAGDMVKQFDERIKALHDSKALGPLEAEEAMIKGHQRIASASLEGIINRAPEAAIELIKSGYYKQYLPTSAIDAYDKKAKTMKDALERDAKTEAAERKQAELEAWGQQIEDTRKSLTDQLMDGKLTDRKLNEALNKFDTKQMPAAVQNTFNDLRENMTSKMEQRRDRLEREAAKREAAQDKADNKVLVAQYTAQAMRFKSGDDPADVQKFTDTLADEVVTGRLNPATARAIANEAAGNIKMDPVRAAARNDVLSKLSSARTSGLFGEDKMEADLEHARQLEAFRLWLQQNPDKSPNDYYNQVMKPIVIERVIPLTNVVIPGLGSENIDPKRRREEMNLQPPKKPAAMDDWLKRAKAANPGVSEEDLIAYYKKKNGVR